MTLTLELSIEEEALLRSEAAKAGMDEAAYLRSLLHTSSAPHALRSLGAPADLGGRSIADLIEEAGTVEDLPADLSTNPKYMEEHLGRIGVHGAVRSTPRADGRPWPEIEAACDPH